MAHSLAPRILDSVAQWQALGLGQQQCSQAARHWHRPVHRQGQGGTVYTQQPEQRPQDGSPSGCCLAQAHCGHPARTDAPVRGRTAYLWLWPLTLAWPYSAQRGAVGQAVSGCTWAALRPREREMQGGKPSPASPRWSVRPALPSPIDGSRPL